MTEYLFIIIAALAAIALPIIGIIAVLGFTDLNRSKDVGYLHLAPYAILCGAALDILLSGRSLDNFYELLTVTVVRSSVSILLVRVVTVFLMMASLERILASARIHRHLLGNKPILTWCFGLFWLGSVGLNMAFSAHPYFAHEYLYSLVLGLGILALTPEEAKKFIQAFRNGLILFLAASFFMILIKPSLVMESNYSQGYIAGLPRMAGLAAHAVLLGELSLLTGLLLWMYPLQNRLIQIMAIMLAVVAFFLAQSKTAWFSAVPCMGVMLWYRYKLRLDHSVRKNHAMPLLILIIIILSLVVATTIFAFSGIGDSLARFLSSNEGSQLTSLTGRDVIWDFALSEWSKYPTFGYGPEFLNLNQRLSIGMTNAVHAHNQFIDLLARSGMVGFLSVLPYLATVCMLVRKVDLAYKSLAMAFLIAVLIRCVSEVPLSLYGYGVELLVQLSLLAILMMQKQKTIDEPTKKNLSHVPRIR